MIDYSTSDIEQNSEGLDNTAAATTTQAPAATTTKTPVVTGIDSSFVGEDSVADDSAPVSDHLYHGLVDDVPVKRPGYILYVCLFIFLLFSALIYLLGSKDGAYVFADLIKEETEFSLKDQVNELLEKVARLRAQSSYDSAYVLLRDFHEDHPEESNVNRELGWHNMEKGLFVFAAEYYSLAEEVTPQNSRLKYYQGELSLRWGRSELAKTRTGSISTITKVSHLSAAVSHLEQSKDCFAAALKGPSLYNVDSAAKKGQEAETEWLSARYKKTAIQSIKALEEDRKDRTLLKKYYNELTNLLKEEALSPDLKQQILGRRADLMREL